MFVEIKALLLKIFANHYCINFLHIFQIIILSTFFTSSQLLFRLILKLVSAVPTYCFLHKMHSIKYRAAGTVDVVEYLIYIFALLTLIIAAK